MKREFQISVKAIEKWLDDDMKMVLTEKILDVNMPPFSKIIIDVDLEGELKYDVAWNNFLWKLVMCMHARSFGSVACISK